jgi:hypothetical protein
MCIINEPAEVSNTEILVSPNHDNTRQIVVYANKVSTHSTNNAMILPVPHPETVKLHDLSNYTEIFKDCAKCFSSRLKTLSYSNSRSLQSFSMNDTLEVHQCGSYNISIVPAYDQFHRLDRRHFQLNSNTGAVLRKYYDSSFGFIVCKLRTGQEQYHPVAYSHKIYKNNLMFVPTRHHHGNHEETISDYDHDIYSINTKPLCGSETWNYSFKVNTSRVPEFDFPEILCFNKFHIKKNELNTDMYFYLDSHIEAFGQHHGVDGCVFKTNHPEITFKNRGSIYIQPFFRGLSFLDKEPGAFNYNREGIAFAGKGTTFVVNGNDIKVIDDVGTPDEHELNFKFNPRANHTSPAVYKTGGRLTSASEIDLNDLIPHPMSQPAPVQFSGEQHDPAMAGIMLRRMLETMATQHQ